MDPQTAAEAARPFINWQINAADLVAVAVAALAIYGRLVKIETKLEPIWRWWLARAAAAADQEEPLIERRIAKRRT